MRYLLLSLLILIGFSADINAQRPRRFSPDKQFVHDPVVACENGIYYIFSTGMGVDVLVSKDNMKTWEPGQSPLDPIPQWAKDLVPAYKGHTWAPDIQKVGDRWYLYYSCSTFGKNVSVIGLTTNKTLDPSSPDYKWEDQGMVVQSVPEVNDWNAIDPNLIIDEEGNPWLNWGSFWDGIQLVRLDKDLKTFIGEPKTIARRYSPERVEHYTVDANVNAIEGPFIVRKDGYYYLFASFDYCCRGEASTYKTVVGRSKHIEGPYLDQEGKDMLHGGGTPVIGPNDKYYGVGHCSVYEFDGKWYYFGHGYDKSLEGASVLVRKQILWVDGWPRLTDNPDFSNTLHKSNSWTADNGNGTFTNPLLYDEFSDPDVIRVGDDYYLAGTTMHAVPGLVILHSKDLVNWENVSYCFDRFDFDDDAFSLKNGQEIYGQGIWAPCIRYANDQFYLYSNINGKGLQCYTSKNIEGPWVHHNMQGKIYDLSVLFDDDGKIYAIHGYGEVHCTELKPDMSGPIEETDRIIIPNGSAVGEGHHMYKINGQYYLISTDYRPNGRTLCSRSESIWGPYETRVITADETFGYHPVGLTEWQGRIVPDGSKFTIGFEDVNATAATNIHQGGIVQTQKGDWYALLMQDFHSVGRTVTLAPLTWKNGWPMVGLEGNFGRAPRTWKKPDIPGTADIVPHAAYVRDENFDGKTLGRIWQWNHNPDDRMWRLKGGRLQLNTMPADQFMWARNTLTQRAIGPRSICTVELYTGKLKDGDVAGLGNLNIPCSWIGVVKEGNSLTLRCFEQLNNDTLDIDITDKVRNGKLWLQINGDYDNNRLSFAYSVDGSQFDTMKQNLPLSYQLVTFQGVRISLFAFNRNGRNGGIAEFDNFTCVEPDADRSGNIPYGKTFRIINLATDRPMFAMPHGLLHDTEPVREAPADAKVDNTSQKEMLFHLVDRGNGKVMLQCEDGRYVFVSGTGLPGDVRLTNDASLAEEFLWQDYLNHEFMLMSTRTNTYIGKSPTTGSPYSMDYKGADPARKNGAVFRWEE